MYKIKKGDTVQIIKGKDRGKRGKVLTVLSGGKRGLVEGLNLVKKHMRKTREDQKGGMVSIEAPINMANLMLLCKHCNRPTRVGFVIQKDASKSRFCKLCKESI
jgi:large subunit ribosomal protein L24